MSSPKPATSGSSGKDETGGATPFPTRAKRSGRGGAPLLFLAPALLVVFAVLIFPILFSLFVSTWNWPLSEGLGPRVFVGMGNYLTLFTDSEFWNSLRLQLGFVFIALPIELILGYAAALLLNREFFGAGFVRTLLLLPVFFLPVLSGIIWRFMLQPRYGPLAQILVALGIPETSWLGTPGWAYAAVILQDIWRMWPFMFMLIYAGLSNIPGELLEAAEIDGARYWQRVRIIITPLLTPTIMTALLLRLIDALRIFSEVFAMTEGGPGTATLLFSLYANKQAFTYMKVGMASAMAIFLLVLSVVFALTLVRRNMSLEELERKAGN